jgi:hypothetical protein
VVAAHKACAGRRHATQWPVANFATGLEALGIDPSGDVIGAVLETRAIQVRANQSRGCL